jgi:hypothetical protein
MEIVRIVDGLISILVRRMNFMMSFIFILCCESNFVIYEDYLRFLHVDDVAYICLGKSGMFLCSLQRKRKGTHGYLQ